MVKIFDYSDFQVSKTQETEKSGFRLAVCIESLSSVGIAGWRPQKER